MIFLNYTFPYMETLLAALIGAIIGQLSILFFGWIKKIWDLKNKKKLIFSDLNSKTEILMEMKEELKELKKLFEDKNTEFYTGNVFHNLNKDIYESITKIELHKCFKDKLPLLIHVYESIDFLKTITPFNIYNKYVEKLNVHLTEKKNDSTHQFYCITHMSFIQIAIKQIDNNLDTIESVKSKIKELVKG